MKEKTSLSDLFLVLESNKKRRIKRIEPVTFEIYVDILKAITNINLNNIDNLNEKYKIYVDQIINKIYSFSLTDIGIYSKNNTNLKYYIDRGWNQEESKILLNNRQSIYSEKKLGKERFEKAKELRKKTYYSNYKTGNHKIFYRPSQIEYWVNKGFSEIAAKQEMFNYYSSLSKKFHQERRDVGKEFLTVRQLKYWESIGLSIEEAKKQLQKIQDTRSLKSYIERYGKEEGTKKFNIVIKKWLKTLDNKSEEEKLDILIRKIKRFKRYSKASIDLFEAVLHELKIKQDIHFSKVYHSENEYFIYDYTKKKINFYDLCINDIKLIVEYHGIMFHPNKKILSKKEWRNWYNIISGNDADTQHKIDQYKKNLAKDTGFRFIEIWENETFEANKNEIINEIIKIYE